MPGTLPLVRFDGPWTDVSEGAGYVERTLKLSAASTEVVTVIVEPSSYRHGDMDTARKTVAFQPGETTATVRFAIVDDAIYEAKEIFSLDIVSATNAVVDLASNGNQSIAYILDNDVPAGPLVRFDGPWTDVSEGAGYVERTLKLSAASTEVVTVVVEPSSYRHGDMDTAPKTVAFQPGETTATVRFAIVDDAIYEAKEIFSLDIVSATNAVVDLASNGNQSIAYILDNDVPAGPLVRFDGPWTDVSEGAGYVERTLKLSAASTEVVTVIVEPSSYRHGDMDTARKTVAFQPGETTATVRFAIVDDAIYEAKEIFSLDIVSATNAVVDLASNGNQSIAYILDNDIPGPPPATAVVIAPASVTEGADGSLSLSVTLKNLSSAIGTVTMSLLPGGTANAVDLSAPAFVQSFSVSQSPAGDYSIALPAISLFDDLVAEPEKVIELQVRVSGQVFENGTDTTVVRVRLLDGDQVGAAGGDTLAGTNGKDLLVGGGGGDNLTGGAGADTFRYLAAADSKPDAYDIITDFTTLSDVLDLSGVTPTEVSLITSGVATFVFVNTPGGQMTIAANGRLNGADVTVHDSHGFYMIGDGAANTLVGGANGDVIQAGAGDDVVIGGGGGDVLFGEAGADIFKYLAAGDSNAAGSDGIFVFQTGVDKIDLATAAPNEVSLIRSGGSTFLFASTAGGPMQLATVNYDLNASDLVTGMTRGIFMIGDSTADTLVGGGLNDVIQAGAGADVVIGGAGGDAIWGGAGADVFKYLAAGDSSGGGVDTVFDFQSGVDKIDLTGVRTGASDAYGLLSSGGSTFVFVDLGGDGVGDMTIQLNGVAGLLNGDILF